jgi:hypothetical protein
MGAVRHREGVVDEDIAERGELPGETGIVALLAQMEASARIGPLPLLIASNALPFEAPASCYIATPIAFGAQR